MKWFIVISIFSYFFNKQEIIEKAGKNHYEVEKFLQIAEEKGYTNWAEFLLSAMPSVDLANLKAQNLIRHFEALDENLKRVPWSKKIDSFLFYHYILPHRVSQEPLEDFTPIYKDTLYGLIKNVKNMREAVLRINEWVFTKMRYKPTARWDQNALTTIHRGFGRCEEMAILCIKALRTVCIPARNVYTPWWPFTNSNHAWVEAWIDGKWYFLGGGEPTELNNAWFALSSKRAAIIKGISYGEVEEGKELIYKREKDFTIINVTPNYTETVELFIQVKENNIPSESVSVSICVYNYSSLPPVGLKKTDENGVVKFVVGKTDLFIYAYKDSLRDWYLWRPSQRRIDTVVLNLSYKEFPDTTFWIYTRRIEVKRKKTKYKPNMDSLKLLQRLHLREIEIVDSALIPMLCEKDKKLVEILYNAKEKAKAYLNYYKTLPDSLKELFIDYLSSLHPKDIVTLDTLELYEELLAVYNSIKLAKKDIPDSVFKDYLLSDRILFEQIGKWRKIIQSNFTSFRKKRIEKTVESVLSWVRENIRKEENRGYFGPMMNPADVYTAEKATEIERYILVVGILRSLGIPARIKWSYDAIEYWNNGWKEVKFEKKITKEKTKKAWIALKFVDNAGNDITSKQRYYYDYSITRFEKYPERLEPPIDTSKGYLVVTLDDKPVYVVTGWRNGYGDTYVRIKKVIPTRDTAKITVNTGIPEKVKPGELVVRKYTGLKVSMLGINEKELKKGKVLLIVFDTESEASKSTLQNAKDVINGFNGKVYLFAVADRKTAEEFLKETGIYKGNLYTITEEIYRKQWHIKNLPSIIYLENNKCILWLEGLILHLSKLLKNLK